MSDGEEIPRKMFSHQQYINLVINTGTGATGLAHDYSTQSTGEDPRMIAFFDSLVQREVDRSFSDSDDSEVSPDSMFMNFSVESENSDLDSDSDASVSSFQLSLIRMSQHANDDSDDDDDDDDDNNSDDSQSNVMSFVPSKKRRLQIVTFSSSDDDSNEDTHNKKHKDNKNQEGDRPGTSSEGLKTKHAKTDSTGSGMKRKSAHTTTDESSSSSSDDDDPARQLRDTQLKRSRLMRRFASCLKKRKMLESDSTTEASVNKYRRRQSQLDHDRMINLRQRWAYCKALKARMAKSNAEQQPRTVPRLPNEDNLDIIAEHLDRSASQESRTAISRLRRRVILEESGRTQQGASQSEGASLYDWDQMVSQRSKSTSQKCSACNRDNHRCNCTEENIGHESRKRAHSEDSDDNPCANKSSRTTSKTSPRACESSPSDKEVELDRHKSRHKTSRSKHKASTSHDGENTAGPSSRCSPRHTSSTKTSPDFEASSKSNSKSNSKSSKESGETSQSNNKSSHTTNASGNGQQEENDDQNVSHFKRIRKSRAKRQYRSHSEGDCRKQKDDRESD